MEARPTPSLGTVLTVLRTIRGWSAGQLAAAHGIKAGTVNDYEADRKVLSRTTLRRLVATMSFPAQVVDRTVSFVESVQNASRWGQGERSAVALDAQIESIAAEIGASVAAWADQLLTRLTREGQVLEARREAHGLWARLQHRSEAERRVLVGETAEFKSWALCELLCAESEQAAAHSAAQAVALAELALLIAASLPEKERARMSIEPYAWAFAGNAWRVAGDLAAAERAFARSGQLAMVSRGPSFADPLDHSRLMDLEASLRREQGRLAEALQLLDRALEAGRGGDGTVKILLKKAKTLEALGSYEQAIAELRRVAAQMSAHAPLRMRLVMHLCLLVNFCHLGLFDEAEPLLPEVRELAVRLGNDLDLVRLRWLEGRVAAGRGAIEEAAAAFRRVQEDFAARGIGYDRALVTLELAALLTRCGSAAQARKLLRSSAPVIRELAVHGEAERALGVLHEALESGALTAELARRLVAYFYRARHHPHLRLETL